MAARNLQYLQGEADGDPPGQPEQRDQCRRVPRNAVAVEQCGDVADAALARLRGHASVFDIGRQIDRHDLLKSSYVASPLLATVRTNNLVNCDAFRETENSRTTLLRARDAIRVRSSGLSNNVSSAPASHSGSRGLITRPLMPSSMSS